MIDLNNEPKYQTYLNEQSLISQAYDILESTGKHAEIFSEILKLQEEEELMSLQMQQLTARLEDLHNQLTPELHKVVEKLKKNKSFL